MDKTQQPVTHRTSRRAVLIGLAVLPLAGCDKGKSQATGRIEGVVPASGDGLRWIATCINPANTIEGTLVVTESATEVVLDWQVTTKRRKGRASTEEEQASKQEFTLKAALGKRRFVDASRQALQML